MMNVIRDYSTCIKRGEQGFTLIEMALVLAIMGIVGVIYLEAGIAVSDQKSIHNTINEIEDIQNSIIDFTIRSHRLPCPADPSLVPGQLLHGEENKTIVSAPVYEARCQNHGDIKYDVGAANQFVAGLIPWKSFGLLEENAIDPWGTPYRYVVHIRSASFVTDDSVASNDDYLSPCHDGNIPSAGYTCTDRSLGGIDFRKVPYGAGKFVSMLDNFDLTVETRAGNVLTDKVAYAIISAGPNRQFEQELHPGKNIIQDEKCYRGSPCAAIANTEFDDIVVHPSLISIIRDSNHSPEEIDD